MTWALVGAATALAGPLHTGRKHIRILPWYPYTKPTQTRQQHPNPTLTARRKPCTPCTTTRHVAQDLPCLVSLVHSPFVVHVHSYGAPRPANEDRRMATVRALRGMDVGSCPEVDLILKVG